MGLPVNAQEATPSRAEPARQVPGADGGLRRVEISSVLCYSRARYRDTRCSIPRRARRRADRGLLEPGRGGRAAPDRRNPR